MKTLNLPAAIAGVFVALTWIAAAQQPSKPESLAEALVQIEALKKQVAELETFVKSQVEPKTAAAQAPASAPPPGVSTAEPAKVSDAGFVKWNELVFGKSKLKFYGFLRLDGIYDDSRPNNTQIPAFIRSEDPAAPGAFASPKNSEDVTIHPRLTRLGIEFAGPEVPVLWGARSGGKAEIDFYNLPSSESRNAPRMRHAYLRLAWDDVSILAGQTSDVISPIFPIVNPDFVMWGAGNLGDRRPQFRAEWTPGLGPGNLTLQGEVGLTGANDAQDLDPAVAGGFRDGEASGKPTLQARVAYGMPLWNKQKLELGIWGHRAWERTDTAVGSRLATEFDSHAAGLDLTISLYKNVVWLKGEVWSGQNLSDVRGGILQGINSATGEEVDAHGGWLELGVRPLDHFSFHAGHAIDNPADADLAGATTPGRSQNRIWYGAIRAYFDPIEIGLDYLHWTTDWVGFGDGVDNRFQSFVSYKF